MWETKYLSTARVHRNSGAPTNLKQSGSRVDYKNDKKLCQVPFTGSTNLSPLRIDKNPSPRGLEPPTCRLTAECANRLRHGDLLL